MIFEIRHTHHHYHYPDVGTQERLYRIEEQLNNLSNQSEAIMINTSKLLAAVAAERTELASWKALSAAKDQVIADSAAALKAALADNDPAAMAQVQADLDQAASDLSADNADAAAAIAANVPPATDPSNTPPAAPMR